MEVLAGTLAWRPFLFACKKHFFNSIIKMCNWMGKIVFYSSCTSSFTGNRCETFIDSPTVSTTQMITSSTTAAATFSTANPTQSSTQAPTQVPTQFSTQSTSTVSTQSPIQSTTQQTSQQTTQSQTQATTQVSTQAPQLDLCKFYADRNMNICQNNGQCVFISDGKVACM